MGDRVKDKLARIIGSHQPKPLPDAVRTEMSRIIERRMQGLA